VPRKLLGVGSLANKKKRGGVTNVELT